MNLGKNHEASPSQPAANGPSSPAADLLRRIPRLGPIRVALLIGLVQTPHRFRTKRQLWAYCGLALRLA